MIRYARGNNRYDAYPRIKSAESFDCFERAFLADRAKVKGMTYICAPMKINGDNRAHRCREDAEPRAFLPFDFDGIEDAETFAQLRTWFMRYRGFGYTTASHTVEKPRCRVVLEASREMDRDACKHVCEAIERDLHEEFGDGIKLDPSVYRAEQPCYTPLHSAETFRFLGEPIDVGLWLKRAPPGPPHGAPDGTGAEDWLSLLTTGADVHQGALRLVGRMVAKGLIDSEIRAWFQGVAATVPRSDPMNRTFKKPRKP